MVLFRAEGIAVRTLIHLSTTRHFSEKSVNYLGKDPFDISDILIKQEKSFSKVEANHNKKMLLSKNLPNKWKIFLYKLETPSSKH